MNPGRRFTGRSFFSVLTEDLGLDFTIIPKRFAAAGLKCSKFGDRISVSQESGYVLVGPEVGSSHV